MRRLAFAAYVAYFFFDEFCGILDTPFFPASPQGKELGEFSEGAIFGAKPVAILLLAPLTGQLVKRFGLVAAMTTAVAARACCFILFGLTPILAATPAYRSVLFIAWNFLGGASDAVGAACGVAFIARFYHENMTMAWAAGSFAGGLGLAIGPFAGGLVYEASAPLGTSLQFLVPYLASGVLILLAGAAMLCTMPRSGQRERERVRDFHSLLVLNLQS